MKPNRMPPLNWSRSAGIALTATLVTVCCPAVRAADWLNNATSIDWNDPTNWQGGAVPNDIAAGIFSATGNIATISSDVTATPSEILIGGFGNTGRLDHVAGTLNTHNVGWPPGWMLVGLGDTGNATYNLANTATTGGALTGYGTGSGTLNLADALFMGEPNGSNAGTGISTINVNTTGALNVQWGMFIGVSGWTANVNVDAGTVHANDFSLAKIQNGNATAAAGNLNISGGSVIANYRMTLADGGANNSATVTQNGGAVSLGSAADAGWAGLSMASATGDGNGGTATYNLNGGTLSTRYVISENSGANTKGTSTFNFNGGTLKAMDNRDVPWAQLIGGDQAITHAYVKAGGAVIDTNGFNVLVGQSLEGDIVSTGGGLTKNGEGTLTLAGANTYTGKTTVTGGSLALATGGSIANSSEIALNGGNFNVSAVTGFALGETQTLTGNGGSVTGDITVAGTLAIGNSPGTMTFNDDLTIGASAVSNFELTDIVFGSGSYDLAQGGDGSQTVTFGGALNLFFSGGTYADNSTVQIFNFETYDGDFETVNFSGLGSGQSATFDASTGFVTVIPEPGAALLGGIGLLALLRRRRD